MGNGLGLRARNNADRAIEPKTIDGVDICQNITSACFPNVFNIINTLSIRQFYCSIRMDPLFLPQIKQEENKDVFLNYLDENKCELWELDTSIKHYFLSKVISIFNVNDISPEILAPLIFDSKSFGELLQDFILNKKDICGNRLKIAEERSFLIKSKGGEHYERVVKLIWNKLTIEQRKDILQKLTSIILTLMRNPPETQTVYMIFEVSSTLPDDALLDDIFKSIKENAFKKGAPPTAGKIVEILIELYEVGKIFEESFKEDWGPEVFNSGGRRFVLLKGDPVGHANVKKVLATVIKKNPKQVRTVIPITRAMKWGGVTQVIISMGVNLYESISKDLPVNKIIIEAIKTAAISTASVVVGLFVKGLLIATVGTVLAIVASIITSVCVGLFAGLILENWDEIVKAINDLLIDLGNVIACNTSPETRFLIRAFSGSDSLSAKETILFLDYLFKNFK